MIVCTSLAVFLFSAIALVVASGFSLGAALLLLCSMALPWKRPPAWRLNREDWILAAVFGLYFAINALSNLVHAAPIREYDAPLRFLLAIAVLPLLLAYPPRPAALWSGLALGAIGAGLFAGWQTMFLGAIRAGGTTNPIQYGNISLLLGVLCLAGLPWAQQQLRKTPWTLLLVAGALLGAVASLLSGSRGSWLSLPLCLVFLYFQHASATGSRLARRGLIALCAIFAVLWMLPQSTLQARSQLAFSEARNYLAHGNADSSVGARLEMWRTGIAMAPGHLLLGWGKAGFIAHKAELVQQGQAAPSIEEHTHLHNEYLDALVKRGIPGLLAVLLLYLTPLALFARHLVCATGKVRFYAAAGVILNISYLAFGLTQAFLSHNNGVMIYAFMTMILWACLRAQNAQHAP